MLYISAYWSSQLNLVGLGSSNERNVNKDDIFCIETSHIILQIILVAKIFYNKDIMDLKFHKTQKLILCKKKYYSM